MKKLIRLVAIAWVLACLVPGWGRAQSNYDIIQVPASGILKSDGTWQLRQAANTDLGALLGWPFNCTNQYVTGIGASGAPTCDSSISPTMSGAWIFSHARSTLDYAVSIANSFPAIGISNTSASTDNKKWIIYSSSGTDLNIGALNDAETAEGNGLIMTRSGGHISTVSLATNNVSRIGVDTNGKVTIAAPDATIPLSIVGRPNAGAPSVVQVLDHNNGSTLGESIQVDRDASTASTEGAGAGIRFGIPSSATYSTIQHAGGQTEIWQYNGSWNLILHWDTSRNPYLALSTTSASNGYLCRDNSAGMLSYSASSCGTSARRFKTNIQPYLYDPTFIERIQPITYEATDEPALTKEGFIADDVRVIDPNLPTYENPEDCDKIRGEQHLTDADLTLCRAGQLVHGLQYDRLTVPLIAEAKRQHSQLLQLQTQNDLLNVELIRVQKRLAALEAQR